MRLARGISVALALTAMVAGCSKQPAEREPDTNIVDEAPPPPPPPVETPRAAEPAPPKLPDPAANIAEILPPDEAPSADEQMLEDADATGLTSRSTRASADTAQSDPVGDLIANDGAGN